MVMTCTVLLTPLTFDAPVDLGEGSARFSAAPAFLQGLLLARLNNHPAVTS